jgi:hypothetical protein
VPRFQVVLGSLVLNKFLNNDERTFEKNCKIRRELAPAYSDVRSGTLVQMLFTNFFVTGEH